MGKQPQQIRSTTDYAEHLIRLQINQDTNSQAWTKFFITIQTGLGTAFIRKYNHLPGNQPERVFPMQDGETDPKTIDEIDVGQIGGLMVRFCEATVLFWIMAAVTALVIWGSTVVPTR